MDVCQKIFEGPEECFDVPECSLGEFIRQKLNVLPPEQIQHIHAETGQQMSNGEFGALSEGVACGLESLGVSSGDVVALLGENSFNISVATTASILINAAFAPLDPSLTPYEILPILKSYQPKCVFCNFRDAGKIQDALDTLSIKAPIVLLDVEKATDSKYLGYEEVLKRGERPTKKHLVKDFSKEVAAILPSSGSTGLPKGVAFSHKTIVWMLTKMCSRTVFAGCFLQSSHLFWMSGIFSLLGTFVGTKRVFLNCIDVDNVLNAIQQYKPDLAFLSPSHLATVIKRPSLTPNTLEPLKVLLTGGGPLQKFVADQFQKIFKMSPMLIQFYALTENAGNVTSFAPRSDVMSVGHLDSGIKLKIVDLESGKNLGEEQIGEIRVKHPYQMVGYYGNPEATKDSFDEDGWLKTGDLGYMKAGLLYISGRIKLQIKYRNMQVSTTEIEELLIAMEGVEDVGVEGIPHEEDHYHPIALVVKSPNSTITAHDIHNYVEEHLSPHKRLRGGVVFVESIPRTTHSKLRRKDLKELALRLYPEAIKPLL